MATTGRDSGWDLNGSRGSCPAGRWPTSCDDRDRDPQRPRSPSSSTVSSSIPTSIGTIGRLTLRIVATMFLAFWRPEYAARRCARVCVPVYVAAFHTGSFQLRRFRPASILLAVIVWLLAWTRRAYLAASRGCSPGLGSALALDHVHVTAAIVGALLQDGFAPDRHRPRRRHRAHAGAMMFGYLVLAGHGRPEWRVLGTTGTPRAGLVQLVMLFARGLHPRRRPARRGGPGRRDAVPPRGAYRVRPVRCPDPPAPLRTTRLRGLGRARPRRRRRSGSSSRSGSSGPRSSSRSPPTANVTPPTRDPRRQRPLGVHRRGHEYDVRDPHDAARGAGGRRRPAGCRTGA